MRLIDAHTHLNAEPLLENRSSYLQAFVDAGGVGLVNVGASESYNIHCIDIAEQAKISFPGCIVKAALGRHPLECVEHTITIENMSEKMHQLKTLYSDHTPHVVAIGETGLDLHYPDSLETLEIQKKLFIEHCEFARETGLPIVVHSRDAFKETMEVLQEYTDLTIYFHCRGYGSKEFEILNSKFEKLFVGFCGNVTYKKAEEIRETLKIVPLTKLLLETDAPYLSPQALRGETNHPANVRYIYEFVAELLMLDPENLSRQIEENFHRVYSI